MTNRQDESVQKHVSRTKQGKAAKSGETKPTAAKPTGTKATGMSQGRSGGDYYHGYSTGGTGSYHPSSSTQMRANLGTGRMHQLYRPDKHPDAVLGQSAAAKIHMSHTSTMHTHGQTRGYDPNVSGGGYPDYSSQGQYDFMRSTSYDHYSYPEDRGISDPGASYKDKYYQSQSTGVIRTSVADSSTGSYSLRSGSGSTSAQTHTQTLHALMDVDDPGQRSPNRPGNDYRDQPMETEYQSSFGQSSSQLAPVHTHPLDPNPYPATHRNHGDERHVGEHVYQSNSEYLADLDRKSQEREEVLRKKPEWEEFDPLSDESRGFHTDPSDEHRHSTRDDSSDHRHAGESFQQQYEEQEAKASGQRHRTQSESESRRTTQTEADQGVRQDQLLQSGFNLRPQRQVSRDFHNFRDKESFMLHNCDVEHGTDPTVYIADLKETSRDPGNKVKKVEFGKKNSSCPEKVVMLVGSTGSGKSTMINAVVNYMFGIDWDDQYRLKLINEAASGHVVNQAVSQTGMITAYTIHHQPWFTVPYTLTIVDTPGFGDTGGLKRDKEIMDQIRKFFETQGSGGIDHLDGVGFVTQAAMPRLTPTQRYIFDSILSIFGKDIAQNIFMLLTFADGQKPQVLSGLKEANMEYQDFYKFNNSALYVGGKKKSVNNQQKGFSKRRRDASDEDSDDSDDDDDDDESSFNQMFWKMGTGNFNRFMSDLESVKPRSLQLTAEVLQERNELEITVNKIQENIKVGLKKLDQLKMEQELLKHHQADIDKNRDFTYEVDEWIMRIQDLPPGENAMNCNNCQVTCHMGKCRHMMGFCGAFSWSWRSASCRHCPYYCSFSMHEKQPFKYVMESVKVTRTSSQLKRRYEEAEGKKLSAKQLIERCSDEFEVVQTATLQLMERARKCLKRLDEIALKPNPLSTTDYIDLMIQEEEFIAGPGWKVRQHNASVS